ncbi:hypothetical protein DP923_16440 [Pontibacter arcticus]|uniref:Uncharacterized protein n=1 Tax=Pontibacter arcticus TaxID=2080288 RepID=A0A364RAV8_9BACT|nr:hypothetical protein DP923_16095 [Pontibacter arcticus]RAU81419.1 hypothetical protein DP923_16440 [Pontibacter arcticus]
MTAQWKFIENSDRDPNRGLVKLLNLSNKENNLMGLLYNRGDCTYEWQIYETRRGCLRYPIIGIASSLEEAQQAIMDYCFMWRPSYRLLLREE